MEELAAELMELDAANEALQRQFMAQGVMFPPGTFENMKLAVYLEHLLGPDETLRAKVAYARQAKAALENMDRAVREARLRQGGQLSASDMDKIVAIDRNAR